MFQISHLNTYFLNKNNCIMQRRNIQNLQIESKSIYKRHRLRLSVEKENSSNIYICCTATPNRKLTLANTNPCLKPISRTLVKSHANKYSNNNDPMSKPSTSKMQRVERIVQVNPLHVQKKKIQEGRKDQMSLFRLFWNQKRTEKSSLQVSESKLVRQRKMAIRPHKSTDNYFLQYLKESKRILDQNLVEGVVSKSKVLSLKENKEGKNQKNKIYRGGEKKKRPKTSATPWKLNQAGLSSTRRGKKAEIKPTPMYYGEGQEGEFKAWEVDSLDFSRF